MAGARPGQALATWVLTIGRPSPCGSLKISLPAPAVLVIVGSSDRRVKLVPSRQPSATINRHVRTSRIGYHGSRKCRRLPRIGAGRGSVAPISDINQVRNRSAALPLRVGGDQSPPSVARRQPSRKKDNIHDNSLQKTGDSRQIVQIMSQNPTQVGGACAMGKIGDATAGQGAQAGGKLWRVVAWDAG